jgi:hypothetical protein
MDIDLSVDAVTDESGRCRHRGHGPVRWKYQRRHLATGRLGGWCQGRMVAAQFSQWPVGPIA